MPIQLPNIDNKTYDDLVKELLASIPKYSKEWTNFNPSDPGITILELLSWVSEAIMYRADRIPEETYMNFLRIIAGSGTVYDTSDKAHQRLLGYIKDMGNGRVRDIIKMQAEAQRFLNSRYRAVTENDFQELALEASDLVKRAKVLTSHNKVNIIIIPDRKGMEDTSGLIKTVRDYLEPRLLIGTVVDVRTAEYSAVNLEISIVSKSYAKPDDVKKSVEDSVTGYLDSVKGGPEGKGWPYGRNLLVYELFHVVERIETVEHVLKITESGKVFKELSIGGLISLDGLEVKVTGDANE